MYKIINEYFIFQCFLINYKIILKNEKITVLKNLNKTIPLIISNINPLVIIPLIIQYNEKIYNPIAILFSVFKNYYIIP